MFGSVLLLIAMLGPMVLLATFLYYRYPDTAVSRMNQCIPPAISAISAWALCTSWLWFYLFNFYLSLPAFLLALAFHIYATLKKLNPKLQRINSALLLATFVMGLLSFFYFDI
ncbi:hypothetical protein [Flagellimonas sp.]|uniref:hypothetical protein n=1 Tax=Flagellimonas sp. TaxID=2058762 RepID=UPI003BAB7C84